MRAERGTGVTDSIASALRATRQRYGLSKTAMIRLLQRHGLPSTTFATYTAWEAGTQPKPAYAEAVRRALRRIGRGFERIGVTGSARGARGTRPRGASEASGLGGGVSHPVAGDR